MSDTFTVYTVTASHDESRREGEVWTVGQYTVEATAETIADEVPNPEITTTEVPLPDLIIKIKDGFVHSVYTTDGIEVSEVTVHDYDTDQADNLGDGGTDDLGYYEEYSVA